MDLDKDIWIQIGRQINGQIGRWMDGWMDGWMDSLHMLYVHFMYQGKF